jgi:signal transduction histidine kinase/ActR/RegA family two-component response regulator
VEYENLRLKALKDYDILDTPPEKELDEITKLASMICETPICLISLLDETRQWFKSRVGLESRETRKSIAFCLHAIQQDDVFEIRDALQDQRFSHNPLVLNDPHIRFYAGMPLKTPEGYNIGTMCIIDTKPRILDNRQRCVIETLARQVITNFELRKNNKELKEISEITMKLAKTKDDFLSNMSHELRTPLNAIYGFTEILNKTNLDRNQKEHVSIIKSSVEILVSIINDILDYSKLENGKLKLENNPFNLRDLLKGIYELLKIKAQEKNLSFKVYMERTIPSFIFGDRVRLNQILMNLLGNAIKFTNIGFVVLNIRLVKETHEDIKISFSVKDSGIGIPQEKLDEIFNRFEQAHGTTSVFGGTGLGLSIAKSLVELQEGNINVKSVYGKGSEFYFNLKYSKMNETEVDKFTQNEIRQSIKSNHCFNNLRVLLVEDVDVNIRLIEKIAEGKGIKLDTAKNGRICLEKLKENKYNLILMDLQMPEMNGYEATSYIRNRLHNDIPIIALSANISEIDKMKCLELGMNDYLTKPFKVENLLSAISKCLSVKNIREVENEN